MSRLSKMIVEKISFVKAAATRKKFLLLKSAKGKTPEQLAAEEKAREKELEKKRKEKEAKEKKDKELEKKRKEKEAKEKEKEKLLAKKKKKEALEKSMKELAKSAVKILRDHKGNLVEFVDAVTKDLKKSKDYDVTDDDKLYLEETAKLYFPEEQLLQKSAKELEDEKKLNKTDDAKVIALLKSRDDKIEALEKRLEKQDKTNRLRNAKDWITANARFAVEDIDVAAKELVELRDLSKSAAETFEKSLVKASTTIENSSLLDDLGTPGAPSDSTTKLLQVKKNVDETLQKGETSVSPMDLYKSQMKSRPNLLAYMQHRQDHLRNIRRSGQAQ